MGASVQSTLLVVNTTRADDPAPGGQDSVCTHTESYASMDPSSGQVRAYPTPSSAASLPDGHHPTPIRKNDHRMIFLFNIVQPVAYYNLP